MSVLRFKVGDKVTYRNNGGWSARGTITEAEEDIKNGSPGYSIELDTPMQGDVHYWGYERQFSR